MKINASEQCYSEAVTVKEFGLLFIGTGANEIHCRIIADQWVERNPLLQTEP